MTLIVGAAIFHASGSMQLLSTIRMICHNIAAGACLDASADCYRAA